MTSTDLIQVILTLRMTTTQVVKTSVTVNTITVLFRTAYDRDLSTYSLNDRRKDIYLLILTYI